MKNKTGSFEAGSVPLGRTMFKFKQSSEVSASMISVKARGTVFEFGGCTHAGPNEVTSMMESLLGKCGRGGLKRFSPDVSCPYLQVCQL